MIMRPENIKTSLEALKSSLVLLIFALLCFMEKTHRLSKSRSEKMRA
jgi:hypothetical protein